MEKSIIEKAISLRHELHMHPELSGEEKWTKNHLMEYIQSNTDLEIVDCGQWFYAYYKASNIGKGPIGFRADFDAIAIEEKTPLTYKSVNRGVAHKCGHDGHSAALAAFAEEISKSGASRDVYFIFQHGEETGIGGEPCSSLIEKKGIEEVYALHNWPGLPLGTLGIREGTINCASKGLEFIFTGKPAHASQPECGINPSLAISETVIETNKLAKSSKYHGLVLATIVQVDVGERAFGVSAHEGKLLMTVRGQYESELNDVETLISEFAMKRAKHYGLELDVNKYDEFPETFNDKKAIDKIRRVAKVQGFKVYDFADPIRSSEDFGWYLKKTSGALIWIGAGENKASIHTDDFDYNDELIEISGKVFYSLI